MLLGILGFLVNIWYIPSASKLSEAKNMLVELISKNEGKTFELKENAKSVMNILKTIIAFANTAGGTIVIGVEDKTKKILGVENILQEEERLMNVVADSIEPQLLIDIEVVNHLDYELLVIHVPYLSHGPYFYKSVGINNGTYIRLGSTNRLADRETITSLLRNAEHESFDELPVIKATSKDLDVNLIKATLRPFYKKLQLKHYISLGILAHNHYKHAYPTYGAILLFGKNRIPFLPYSIIRCVCYSGITKEKIIDQKDISTSLVVAPDEIIAFIERHINISFKIGKTRREEVEQFPVIAVREAVINALVHSDYSLKGMSIQIAIFSNRIEITNPGSLPFGQTLEAALSGISRIRNHVIGRIFRECKLIERLGSGIPRIFSAYKNQVARLPKFEELNNQFRVTLFAITTELSELTNNWEHILIKELLPNKLLATKEIAKLWGVTARTARMRLKSMLDRLLIEKISTSKTDPTSKYKLK